MSMNLPNKLTMFRVVLIPVFIVVLMSGLIAEPASRYIAVVIFCVASFTDYLDGHIARKYNLVTNFGKFMDPLADKLLVSAAMICMIELGMLPAWVVIIIISREFIITGFRLIAAEGGLVTVSYTHLDVYKRQLNIFSGKVFFAEYEFNLGIADFFYFHKSSLPILKIIRFKYR